MVEKGIKRIKTDYPQRFSDPENRGSAITWQVAAPTCHLIADKRCGCREIDSVIRKAGVKKLY